MAQENRRVIRFGIMCDGLDFQEWQGNAIKSLLKNEQIECGLLLMDKGNPGPGFFNRIIKKVKIKNILWQAYSFLSKKRFKAEKTTNLSSALADTPIIECRTTKKGKFSEYFNDSDIKEIKKYKLDFILRFGFGIIRGEILDSAKYGVWSYHHDDEQKYRGGPPCFWEIFYNDKVTGTILQRLTNKLDGGIVLKKGFLKTSYSYVNNRDQMYFESSGWPAQVCSDILLGNTEYLSAAPSATNAPIFYAPTNIQFLRYIYKSALKKAQYILKKFAYIDYWNIGIANTPIHHFLSEDCPPVVNWLPDLPTNRFFADPFAIAEGEKIHIFYEDFPYKEGKGNIAYTCYEEGQFSHPSTVIKEAFHLSYPYLLKKNGHIYMVPESWEANQVILYKATDFPLKWEKEHVLIDNYAGVDSTLFEYNGNWWMFSSDNYAGDSYNLNLFYADDLFAEWRPHPQNPIKTDVRSARSAGNPFLHNGSLYRPAMDYSEKVEGSITINKVKTITKEKYEEERHNEVRPYANSRFPDKIHTLGETGRFTLIDGCKEVCIFTNIHFLNFKLRSILKKLN